MASPRLFALALSAALLLGACEGDPQTSPSPSPSASASPSASPSPTPSAPASAPVAGIHQTDRDLLTPGGELDLALTDWPDDWNPLATDLPGAAALVLSATTPRLFDVSATGLVTPNPDWLAGAPTVTDDPVTTVTYHLNPDAVWADGTPVTAADFRATWEACAEVSFACHAGFEAVAAVEEGVTPADVTVTYDRVYPGWRATFRGLARAEAAAAEWTDLSLQPGWTAGPYVVAAHDVTAGRLVLEPNPLWWGDAPLLDTVTLERADAAALARAPAAYDAWPIGFDPALYRAASEAGGVQVRRADSADWRVLLLNRDGPLAERALRQGILAALDRPLVAAAALPGLGWTAEPLNHVIYQPGQAGYTDLVAATGLGHDPATARGTFLERRLSLTFLVNPDDPLSEAEGLQIAAQLGEYGVEVTWATPAGGFADALAAGDYDLATVTRRNDLEATVTSPAAGLWRDVTFIPLYVPPDTWAVTPDLANFGPAGLATLRWEDVGW